MRPSRWFHPKIGHEAIFKKYSICSTVSRKFLFSSMLRDRIAILILLLLPLTLYGQTHELAALYSRIHSAKTENERLLGILALCDLHYNIPRDTLDKYAYEAYSLGLRSGSDSLLALAAYAKANDYFRWGWTDSCIVMVDEALPLVPFEKPTNRDTFFKLQRLKAMAYGGKMNYPSSLEILYDLLEKATLVKDSLAFAQNANTIASVALARNQPVEALNWTVQALEKTGNSPQFNMVSAAIFVNKATAYQLLEKWDSARYAINKGLEFSEKVLHLPINATALQKKSAIELALGNVSVSEQALLEMIELRKITGDQNQYVDDQELLFDFYLQTKQPEKVITIAEAFLAGEGVDSGFNNPTYLRSDNINLRLSYFNALAKAYRASGNDRKYGEILEKILNAKDHFYDVNSQRAISEIQTKYEVQQKENTIIQQQLDIEKRQRWIYGILGATIITVLSAVVLILLLRRRQRIRIVKLREKERFQREKAILAAKEEERKRISSDLHDNLGAYAASINSNLAFIKTDSLNNAGQTAVKELKANSQAMISELNDTIWALKKDSLTLTAILDKLKLFVQRIQASYPATTISFEEEIAEDHRLGAYQALNLYRVLQESVNNALKHADGDQIDIKIESSASTWKITVQDNGKGIRINLDAEETGNGLANMRRRATESGWNLSLETGVNAKGTAIRLFPTTN